ncbi:MAG: thymidylate synthase, partial [Bacteroidia bacterium]
MNKLDEQYLNLLKEIKETGYNKGDRAGGSKAIFGKEIRFNMSEGFPLLTSKKMYTKGIIIELLWFLKGDTNIKYLVDNGVNIWVGDAFKNYVNKCSANDDKWNPWMRNNGNGTLSMFTESEFIEKIKTDNSFA